MWSVIADWALKASPAALLPLIGLLIHVRHESRTTKAVLDATKDNPGRSITVKAGRRFGRSYELTIGPPGQSSAQAPEEPPAVEPADSPAVDQEP